MSIIDRRPRGGNTKQQHQADGGKKVAARRATNRWAAAALLGVVLAAAPAMAADSHLDRILATKELKVGTTGDYRPFSYQDAGGTFTGADIDMAKDLAQSLGVKLVLVKTSWSDLMKDLLADKFDIAMGGISVTLQRQRTADFSTPTMIDGKAAIGRCSDVAKYKTLAEIDQPATRAIVNPGGTNESFVKSVLKRAHLTIYPDNKTIFDQIAAGKADVMLTDRSEVRYQQTLHPGVLCAIGPDRPLSVSEKAYLLPRDPAWKAYVDQWLHQDALTGRMSAILKQWGQ